MGWLNRDVTWEEPEGSWGREMIRNETRGVEGEEEGRLKQTSVVGRGNTTLPWLSICIPGK